MPHPKQTLTTVITAAVLGATSLFAFAGMSSSNSNDSNDMMSQQGSSSQMSSAMMKAVPSQGLEADLNESDKGCLKNAAQINLLEVKLGNLAQDNAQSQAVKDFGQRMVHDHNQLQGQLTALGDEVDGTVPDELDDAHQATYDKMAKLKGSKFDSAYIDAMVKGHKKAIGLAKKETQQGANLKVMNWAAEIHPILAIHEQLAQQAQKSLGGASQMSQ